MLKFLMFSAVLVACGGSDAQTPFDRVDCGSGWPAGTDCDRACEDADVTAGSGSGCTASRPDGETRSCSSTFLAGSDQVEGCCHYGSGSSAAVLFYACQ